MTKTFAVLSMLALLASSTYAGPVGRKISMSEGDLSTADSIGYGYYAAPIPARREYGGYSGYGRYRTYGTYYRPPIYPVWG
ncbi:uncharacterized protein LOC108159883 [Drosophila miranda]|uniref:uncharacterized protein LOC108159883 n=1 Tax=Drosophila miranda TaxID=7229 RepID=UPI00143F2698|nr:uncharacterized protein LOC108159883 [Drosophila miranda]